jgi:hypothetical protein
MNRLQRITKMLEHRKELTYLVSYSDVFKSEEIPNLESLLGSAKREDVLLAGAFFLGFRTYNSEFGTYRFLLSKIFNAENNGFANQLFKRLQEIEHEKGKIALIYPLSCLQLFEFAYQKLSNEGTLTESEFERNLFQALLLLNQENVTKEDVTAIQSVEGLNPVTGYAAFNLTTKFPQFEFLNYRTAEVLTAQLIKAIYLFKYLEDGKTLPLLSAFLNHFDCADWRDYLKSYLPFTHSILKRTKEAHLDILVTPNEKYQRSCEFFEKHALEENKELEEFDFKTVRSKPFYKIGEGKYRVIYELFVLEKVFTGLYFSLSNINDMLDDQHRIKSFKSVYTTEFSEEFLLYTILEHSFPKKWVHLSGKTLRELGLKAEPDYYLRFKNKLFLFENKDILIRADIKQSYDFQLLEPELKKRLSHEAVNDKIKNGAVRQLAQNIRKILKGEFGADQGLKQSAVSVYSILVLHYNQFNAPGLNKIVNAWFQEELGLMRAEGLDVSRVSPLTIVFIDTLILYQDYLVSRRLVLEDLIKDYWKENEVSTYVKPFSAHISAEANRKGFKELPKVFMELGLNLFEETSEAD